EGPKRLAKLKGKLEAMEAVKAREARRKPATRPARPAGQPSSKTIKAKKPRAKAKRKLNLSPERRAQLAAMMKARWAAKRAAAGETTQKPSDQPSTRERAPQARGNGHDGR